MEESRQSNPSFYGGHTFQLARTLQAAFAIERLVFRPFGVAEKDLDVDFSQASQPALVTDILECCAAAGDGKGLERRLLWELQVGHRIECLLRIVSLSQSGETIFSALCRNDACGEPLEVELSVDDLLSLQDENRDVVSVQCGNRSLTLRKPTGADQREWAGREFEAESAAIEAMVRTLIVPQEASSRTGELSHLQAEALSQVDQAMREGDSLVNFSVELICPHCASHSEFEIDLQTLAIQRLEQCRQRLLATVHQLARHYHWSESQIFAVPAWRRKYYLRMLEAELT